MTFKGQSINDSSLIINNNNRTNETQHKFFDHTMDSLKTINSNEELCAIDEKQFEIKYDGAENISSSGSEKNEMETSLIETKNFSIKSSYHSV